MKNSTLASGALLLLATAANAQQSGPKITLNASEEPDVKQWTLPASMSYISNEDTKDSWNVDLAGRIEGQPNERFPHTLFGRAVVQRNTQAKKEVEHYAGEFGGHFEHTFPKDAMPADMTYVATDASFGIEHKTIYPDQKVDCSSTPLPPQCTEQQETSFRAKVALQPFRNGWENTFAYADATHTQTITPAWTYSVLPVLTLFYDDLLDAKRDADGVKPDGNVTGAKVALTSALSPEFSGYRLVLSVKAQYINAFSRSDRRQAGFQQESSLVKISADYELGNRSFMDESSGWVPAIGVSYTKGDDPLTGQLDQDSVTFGFKVTYKSPK